MQHSSVGAPGSAFHSMKSGTGVSEPCCRLVGLASFSDIASHVGPEAEEQPLAEIEDAGATPAQGDRDAQHPEHQDIWRCG